MTDSFYHQLVHHQRLCQQFSRQFSRNDDVKNQIQRYLCQTGASSARRPLIVCGGPGSGKSTLMAVVTQQLRLLPQWEAAMCVIRFCASSVHCQTLDQILYGVIDHLALLHGRRGIIKVKPTITD